jgi:Protein of unknown function (DUF3048) N-terminal domain/Protein of unknown function (DUF3048) C-terminal domain
MGWSGRAAERLRRLAARRPRVTVAAAAGVTLVAALVAAAILTPGANRGPTRPSVAATERPAPAPRSTVTATPPPEKPKGPLLDPFTGLPVKRLGPVLAVKIDNIVNARPQTGLRSADLMYVIPVEGGLTRFMAVFSSHVPPVVGPVRSARESDLDLLRQFGRPAFAWSGAAPHLVPFIERAPLSDLYALRVGGYYRDGRRVAPYNLFANTGQLLREAPKGGAQKTSKARDIGFRFGPLPGGGKKTASYAVKYPAASYSFRWSASEKRWLTWIDGAPARATEGGQLGGSTVIVQYTQIATSRFIEYGGRPPYAKSTGSGRAVVLRDGRAYTVRWVRNSLDGGTTYTLPDGQRMQFARGQTWVVLAPDSHASYVNAGKV